MGHADKRLVLHARDPVHDSGSRDTDVCIRPARAHALSDLCSVRGSSGLRGSRVSSQKQSKMYPISSP